MARSRGKSIRRPQKKTRTRRKKSRNTRKKINRGGDCNAWADKKNPGNAKSNFHKLCELIESTGDIYTITPADSVKLLDDMVHFYFNDPSVLEEIYKSMRSKEFCFLDKITIDVSWNVIPTDETMTQQRLSLSNKIIMFKHTGKSEAVSQYFSPAVYYEKQILDCSSNIYAIPLSLTTSSGAHSNILIVQNNEKEIVVEHFEPHGRFFNYETHLTNQKIAKMVDHLVYSLFGDPAKPGTLRRTLRGIITKTKDGKEIKIIKPKDNCPIEVKDLQGLLSDSKEWDGSCAMFSMWYAFMRLSSPETPSADIYKTMYTILQRGNPVEIIQAVIKAFQGLITVDRPTVSGLGKEPRLLGLTSRQQISTELQKRQCILCLKNINRPNGIVGNFCDKCGLIWIDVNKDSPEEINELVKKSKTGNAEHIKLSGEITPAKLKELFTELFNIKTLRFLDISRLSLTDGSSMIHILSRSQYLQFYEDSHKVFPDRHIGIVVSTIYSWEDVLREGPDVSEEDASLAVKVNLSELSADFDGAGFAFYIGQAPNSCKYCDYINSPNSKFCSECGKKQKL